MRYKKRLLFTLLLFIVTATLYALFIRSPYFQGFLAWSQRNLAIYLPVLFFLKTLGIVYAPIPGGLLTMGSIPILGWQLAYVIDFCGSMTGVVITYFLGKRYGYAIIRKIFDEDAVAKVKHIKIKTNREIECIFVMRVLMNATIAEIVGYAGGLLGMSLWNVMIGSIFSHMIIGIPVYMVAQNIFTGRNFVVNIVFIIISIFLVYKLKGRYFE